MAVTPFPVPGQPQTKRLTTGRLYFTATGASNPVDLGNVVKFQVKNKADSVKHYASSGGVRQVDVEVVHTVEYGYQFTLDEWTDLLAALIQQTATTGIAGNASNAAVTSPWTVTHVQAGVTYSLGAVGLASAVVTDTTTTSTLVSGIDYTVDLINGYITFIASGNFTAGNGSSTGDAISVALTQAPTAKYRSYTSATKPTQTGALVFYETDQNNSSVPRAIHTLSSCSLVIQNQSEEQTTGFRTVDLMVTALAAPVIQERS